MTTEGHVYTKCIDVSPCICECRSCVSLRNLRTEMEELDFKLQRARGDVAWLNRLYHLNDSGEKHIGFPSECAKCGYPKNYIGKASV